LAVLSPCDPWTPNAVGLLPLISKLQAFNVRLDSDYDVKPILNRALAEDILRDAQQFVERAATYLQQEGYQ